MDFVVKKTDFLRELGLTQRIVERKNTIPILANILVEAGTEGLSLTATDLEVGLKTRCAVEVKRGGSVTVSAKKLFEIVRSLPEEDVRIESNDSSGVTITSGRSRFRLVGLEAKDFPNLPACDFDKGWEAPSEIFRRALGKVLFAVTQDDSKFPLSGVLLLGSSKRLTFVATDGHRLAVADASAGLKGLRSETRLLIPRKALAELKQIVELGEAKIACEVKENHVYFRIGDRTLVARMIEDQFPAYEKVVPKANDKKIRAGRLDLEGAVRRAALLSSEKARTIKFSFTKDALVLSASNPDLGEVREEVPIGYDGEEFDIAFNAQYVLDFLAVVEGDDVQLELKDGSTQALLRPVADKKPDAEGSGPELEHYSVIMPMRL